MPLSEHEQRLLEQIERALYAEDPKFATTVRASDPRAASMRAVLRSSLLLVGGIALLIVGVATDVWPLGVLGFLVMFASIYLLVGRDPQAAAPRGGGRPAGPDSGMTRPGPRSTSGPRPGATGQDNLKSRMEQRWERRWEERGGL